MWCADNVWNYRLHFKSLQFSCYCVLNVLSNKSVIMPVTIYCCLFLKKWMGISHHIFRIILNQYCNTILFIADVSFCIKNNYWSRHKSDFLYTITKILPLNRTSLPDPSSEVSTEFQLQVLCCKTSLNPHWDIMILCS